MNATLDRLSLTDRMAVVDILRALHTPEHKRVMLNTIARAINTQSDPAPWLVALHDALSNGAKPDMTSSPCDYRKLQMSGKPYPRSCPECGIGPCKRPYAVGGYVPEI